MKNITSILGLASNYSKLAAVLGDLSRKELQELAFKTFQKANAKAELNENIRATLPQILAMVSEDDIDLEALHDLIDSLKDEEQYSELGLNNLRFIVQRLIQRERNTPKREFKPLPVWEEKEKSKPKARTRVAPVNLGNEEPVLEELDDDTVYASTPTGMIETIQEQLPERLRNEEFDSEHTEQQRLKLLSDLNPIIFYDAASENKLPFENINDFVHLLMDYRHKIINHLRTLESMQSVVTRRRGPGISETKQYLTPEKLRLKAILEYMVSDIKKYIRKLESSDWAEAMPRVKQKIL